MRLESIDSTALSPFVVPKLNVRSIGSLLIHLILDLWVKIDGARVTHQLLLNYSHLSLVHGLLLLQLGDDTFNLHLV